MTIAPLSGKHVVITRPIEQAGKLAALVKAAGGTPEFFPLITIVPLQDEDKWTSGQEALKDADWLIFISSNAVQYGLPRIRDYFGEIPADLRFAAIGPVTAAALEAEGIQHVLTPQDRFDSEALLALPEMQVVQGQKVVIVRGVGGRELLAETLTSRGAKVDFAECYQRINPQQDAGFVDGLWQNGQLDAVVVTSSEAMRHLFELAQDALKKDKPMSWIKNTYLCVNHARIAALPKQYGLKVSIAAAPGDAAMLECLTDAVGNRK